MMMPGMDGKAMIRALRRLNPAVRIIATSGLPVTMEGAGPGGLGAQAVLQKPYLPHTLLATVQEVLAVCQPAGPCEG